MKIFLITLLFSFITLAQNQILANYSTATNVTLTVGTRTDTYTVTTEAQPPSTTGGVLKGSDGKIWRDSTGKIIKVR